MDKKRRAYGGIQYSKQIYINKNSELTKTIPELIHVVCHETQHSIQEIKARKDPNSAIGLEYAIRSIFEEQYRIRYL